MCTFNVRLILIAIWFIEDISCLEKDFLLGSIQEFRFNHPIRIKSSINLNVKVTKKIHQKGLYTKLAQENKEICGVEVNNQFKVIIKDRRSSTLVVLKDSEFDKILKGMECKINDEVYFINEASYEVFETYTINNHRIIQKVGNINQNGKMEWKLDQEIIKRRSDFKGVHLKCMTTEDGMWAKLDQQIQTEAKYFENNQTWEVLDYVSGIVIDVLEIMQLEFNFTASYFLRKEWIWGNVVRYPNGTEIGSGAVGDIYYDRADILAALPLMTLERIPYLDFLIPELTKGSNIEINRHLSLNVDFPITATLIIQKQQNVEQLDLRTFYYPLSGMVWACVISVSIMVAVAKLLSDKYERSGLDIAWASFATNFGGAFDQGEFNEFTYKLVAFIALFCGNIIWMAR